MSLQESAQQFEAAWWGDCTNTFGEEAKQLTYAPLMGLVNEPRDGRWPVYDLAGRSVLDIGGGPASMLLKTVNGDALTVVDPCRYPHWVLDRYHAAGILWNRCAAEEYDDTIAYDEAWCYNVLQHVESPQAVIETAKRHAKVVRIFEWLETPPSEGHPHTLHLGEMNQWLGGEGQAGWVDLNGATGLAYWGVFPGE